jgi:hypothetical protein
MIVLKIDGHFVWALIYWFCGIWVVHIPLVVLWLLGKWVWKKAKETVFLGAYK